MHTQIYVISKFGQIEYESFRDHFIIILFYGTNIDLFSQTLYMFIRYKIDVYHCTGCRRVYC